MATAEAMRQRLREQPVGKPRVARQQRAVQVRADRTADAAAFPAAFAVVAEAGDDAAQRVRARIEARAARVVLEAGQRPPHARLQLALKQDVADHPSLARDRLQREDADPGQIGTVEIQVRTAEQLVTATHRQDGGAPGHGCAQRERFVLEQVLVGAYGRGAARRFLRGRPYRHRGLRRWRAAPGGDEQAQQAGAVRHPLARRAVGGIERRHSEPPGLSGRGVHDPQADH